MYTVRCTPKNGIRQPLQAITTQGFEKPLHWACPPNMESTRNKLLRFRKDLTRLIKTFETPIGVYVLSGLTAKYLWQLCNEMGLGVPEEVGIVLSASEMREIGPTANITYIEQDYDQLGYEAAKMLDELMRGKRIHPLHRRIASGRLLLTETGKPIATIADECGYSTPGQLSRYFSKAVGTTPSTYRKGMVAKTNRPPTCP